MALWRLAKEHFQGPGRIFFPIGDSETVEIEVAADGTFEFEGPQPFPLHSIAVIVGGRRDLARK